jgi:hypothetical protein
MTDPTTDPHLAWPEFCELLEQAGAVPALDDLGLTHCGFGLDNPDNVYSSAGIDPELDDRITGTRGTTHPAATTRLVPVDQV